MNPAELLKKIRALARRGMTHEQIAGELGFKQSIRDRRREVTMSDLRNILMVGIHLAKVDKDFHWEEVRILNKINDIIQLTSEEKQELLYEGFNVMKGLDALVNAKARRLLVKFLCAIAHSDQALHGLEVEFINKVNAQFDNLVTMKPVDAWREYEEEVTDILREEFA